MKPFSSVSCNSSYTGLNKPPSEITQTPNQETGPSLQEGVVHGVYVSKNSSVETEVRKSQQKRDEKKGNPDAQGTPQLAIMQSFGQRIFDQLRKDDNFNSCLQEMREAPEDKAISEELHTICEIDAYNYYAREIGREPVVLSEKQQEELLNGLQEIENDKVYLVAQSFKDMKHDMEHDKAEALATSISTGIFNPAQAVKYNKAEALSSPFYVYYSAVDEDYRPSSDPETGIRPRLTLSVKPEHVVKAAKQLANEYGGTFGDLLSHQKVMAANEHGQSPDNIVIYLCKADPARAKQFADYLNTCIPAEEREKQSPVGMHMFSPGIAYGESSPEATGSFGDERAEVVADAILTHLIDETPLDEAMKNALKSHQYSLENPAFVERPGLQEILRKF